jgi:hypothetical protein
VTKYDYKNNLLVSEGDVYQLDEYRKWLLSNHQDLCAGYFIRAIHTSEGTRFTFDWQSIFHLAEVYNFLKDFINERANQQAE